MSIGRINLDLGVNQKVFNKEVNGIARNAQRMTQSAFSKIGIALGGAFAVKKLFDFGKASIDLASDLTEVQNVVDVTFGAMAQDINNFSKTALQQFGLSELSVKYFTSTMGAMLKSSGLAGQQMKDMSIDLTKLSADMASFYNLSNEAAFDKIKSGIAGISMPLRDLGINMNVVNLEAFALSRGITKSYEKMSQAEQTLLRYNYLMEVTKDSQGDFARTSHTWANQVKLLGEQWRIFMGTMGSGFINVLTPVIRGINLLIRKLQVAAQYFKAFTALIFGDAQAGKSSTKTVENVANSMDDMSDSALGVGKAAKKAGKDIKGSVAGFDEINPIAENALGNLDDLTEGVGGIGDVDLGTATTGALDIDTSNIESKFENLTNIIGDFYKNWGIKDIFDGIKAGIISVNFDNIRENFNIAFSGLKEIARTYLTSMQPVFQSAGQTLGTFFKYGITIAGNLFEPILEGFANFVTNMKEPIQQWIEETSQTIANSYNNMNMIFEIIGESWIESISKYSPQISELFENIFTNFANLIMLFNTIFADVFNSITEGIKDFVIENQSEIQIFTDSIIEMFTGAFNLVAKVVSDVLDDLKIFWDTWGKNIVKTVVSVVTQIGVWFLKLWNDLIKPVWDTMVNWMQKIWNESLRDIINELLGFVGRLSEIVIIIWNEIIKPLIDWLMVWVVPTVREILRIIIDVVGFFLTQILNVVKSIIKAVNGIIDFILGIFTRDWRRAWDGIKTIFESVVDLLPNSFKNAINSIIGIVNKFIDYWNNIKLKVPEISFPFVGTFGGFEVGLPKISRIPKLAQGAIIEQPTLAMIGERGTEAVVPLENNTSWMDLLAEKISLSTDSIGNITIIIKIGDDTIIEKVVKGINRKSRISGETILEI